jgi:hypothetical protein
VIDLHSRKVVGYADHLRTTCSGRVFEEAGVGANRSSYTRAVVISNHPAVFCGGRGNGWQWLAEVNGAFALLRIVG